MHTFSDFSVEIIRKHFPSLERKINGFNVVFFDGPGGTQVPKQVIDAVSEYYTASNANTHGQFQTSIDTDQVIEDARNNMAAFLGAESPRTISIGQNMTTLNYALSVAFGRMLESGDEIVITELDHEANRGPWLSLQEKGIVIREIKLLPEGVLDYEDLQNKVNRKTKVVAIGWASNALGTVNDLALVRKITDRVNALMLVDAVHYAPHFPINIEDIKPDFLLCSGYKFYGPHLGFLYTKPGLLDQLPVNRLRTQNQEAPYTIETGTLNHAAIAGINATIAFISELGSGDSLFEKVHSGMLAINRHEQPLARRLYNEVSDIGDFSIIGPPFNDGQRAPTLALIHKKRTPVEVCKILAEKGIAAWDGHFYAIRAMEALSLADKGGVIRFGISMYNNENDIDTLLSVLQTIR